MYGFADNRHSDAIDQLHVIDTWTGGKTIVLL
jgi:hypothetical protein